jgi:predicted dehydrogenase
MIGAGNFAGQVLVPALQKTGATLKTIAAMGGLSARHLGKKYGFQNCCTDTDMIFSDPEINTVVIATRHDSHAAFVIAALKAGKHVFVEKPLCIRQDELAEISEVYTSLLSHQSSPPLLMVGFNRRFAPHITFMKNLLTAVREPKSFIMTVNAGFIPLDHWTQDRETGGGRVVGEVCHFIDLIRFLTGVMIDDSDVMRMNDLNGDTLIIRLKFIDGSIGTIHYLANGNKAFPKERLEVFCGGRILQLDNFRKMRGYGWPGFTKMNLWRQDKGHRGEIDAFVDAVRNGNAAPIPFDEIVEVAKISILSEGRS